MKKPILSVKNLSVTFNVNTKRNLFFSEKAVLRAIDNVSFNLYEEEVLGIVGESGCGKSTLVRAILQLTNGKVTGDILINDHNISNLNDKELKNIRKNIQIIFQDPLASLNPKMTIKDIIAEPLRVYNSDLKKEEIYNRVFEIMEQVGLDRNVANRYSHEFSGGQCQRIGIARAMILKPKILVCDEVTSALDVSIKAQILNLLQKLKQQYKMSVLFISHDLSVIRHISDRVLVFYLGNLVEVANYDDIYQKPKHPYTEALISSIPRIDNKNDRIILNGDIESPLNIRPGCVFSGRCFRSESRCSKEKPILLDAGNESQVACFYPKRFI